MNLLTYHKSLEVEIHILTLLPHWQPLRHKSLPQVILAEDLCKLIEIEGNAVHIHHIRMDSIVLFHKEDILLEKKSEADKV